MSRVIGISSYMSGCTSIMRSIDERAYKSQDYHVLIFFRCRSATNSIEATPIPVLKYWYKFLCRLVS